MLKRRFKILLFPHPKRENKKALDESKSRAFNLFLNSYLPERIIYLLLEPLVSL